MDTLEQQKISEKTLNNTLSRQETSLPTQNNFKKYSDKNLDTLNVLFYYGKKGHNMDWNHKDYKYYPVHDLIKLGLIKVKPSHDDFHIYVSLTNFGAILAKKVKNGTSKEKHKLKVLNMIFLISTFIMIFSFLVFLMALTSKWLSVIEISTTCLILSMIVSMATQNPTFSTIPEIISKHHYLSEGMYLREINKVMPPHKQEIYKQELAKINNREDEH